MPLFEQLPVDRDAVAAAAKEHYGLVLGDRVKESQNTTFKAANAEGVAYAVRATRDDEHGTKHRRVSDEMAFVDFFVQRGEDCVCAPLHPPVTRVQLPSLPAFTLCAIRWADGEPVDFASMKWATDAATIRCWGATLARLHQGGREFELAHPDIAARMQRWDEVHCAIMAGVALHPDDAAAIDHPSAYGCIHGDLNLSNFHIVHGPDGPTALRVFDWDQTQRGWWEYDLAQAAITTLMLTEGGALPTGDPVPGVSVEHFLEHLVAGYEAAGHGKVHMERLMRMLALRKLFYYKFCKQAAIEGNIPADMGWFIDYINRWMEKHPPSAAQ